MSAQSAEATESGEREGLLRAHAGTTDVGVRRKHNEDAILLEPDIGLYVVCDGVGGHAKGDVASATGCSAIAKSIRDDEALAEDIAAPPDIEPDARRLFAAVHKANDKVIAASKEAGHEGDMGTTVVALLWSPDASHVHVCHVGDSRCYRLRRNKLVQLTVDHNVITEAKRRNPKVSEKFLATLPKNVVTRALGMAATVEPEVRSLEVQAGDVFLLCSDGLHGMVSDSTIRQVIEHHEELELACADLITMANDAGGTDNISAVLVRAEGDEQERPSAPEIEATPSERQLEESEEDALTSALAAWDEDGVEADDVAEGVAEIDAAEVDVGDVDVLEAELEDWDEEDLEVDEEAPAIELTDDEPAEQAPAGPAVMVMGIVDVGGITTPASPAKPPSEPAPKGPRTTYCTACGVALSENAASCKKCGTVIEDEAVIPCPECDQPLVLDSRFCVECGARHDLFD